MMILLIVIIILPDMYGVTAAVPVIVTAVWRCPLNSHNMACSQFCYHYFQCLQVAEAQGYRGPTWGHAGLKSGALPAGACPSISENGDIETLEKEQVYLLRSLGVIVVE